MQREAPGELEGARQPVDTMRHAVKGTAAASRVMVAGETPLASA